METALKYDTNLIKNSTRIKSEFINIKACDEYFSLDLDRVTQAIYNLIVNACHHSPKSEEVYLKITLNKDLLYISVLDHDVGVLEDWTDRIFDPFFSEPTQYYEKGMDLGLIITKTVVENHGGEISLNSKIGQDSEFSMRIPI